MGFIFTSAASVYQGQQDKEAAYSAAKQEEGMGRDEFAAAQRDALDRRLEGELLMSRQQAAAAASGGGAGVSDPTIVRLLTETGERADYNAQTVTYGGGIRRNALFKSAEARRKSGDSSYIGGVLGGLGRFVGGATSLGTSLASM